ncbi:TPA: hypothetical protein ACPFEA_001889, partial [Staphylococcus aureus]
FMLCFIKPITHVIILVHIKSFISIIHLSSFLFLKYKLNTLLEFVTAIIAHAFYKLQLDKYDI